MPPQLGAFSLCDPDFDQFVRNASAVGIRQAALYFAPGRLPCELEKMTDADAQAIRDTLSRHGLTAIAAGGGSNLLTADGLGLLLRKLDGAEKLGVGVFDTGSLAVQGKTPDVVERETAIFCENMAKAAGAAARRGMVICLETHGGLTGTVPSCLRLMKRLSHPHIRIGYDPANILFYEGQSPLDRLAELVPHIGHVHAKDHAGGQGSRSFPNVGRGEVPYAEVIRILVEGGYRGCVSVERAPGDTPEQRLASLREACEFLGRLLPRA